MSFCQTVRKERVGDGQCAVGGERAERGDEDHGSKLLRRRSGSPLEMGLLQERLRGERLLLDAPFFGLVLPGGVDPEHARLARERLCVLGEELEEVWASLPPDTDCRGRTCGWMRVSEPEDAV